MLNLKNKNSFFGKKIPQKAYLVIICNLTHLQNRNTTVKFFLKILEKIHVGSENI